MKILRTGLIVGMLVIVSMAFGPLSTANASSGCSTGRYYGHSRYPRQYSYNHHRRGNDLYFMKLFFNNNRRNYHRKRYCHHCGRYHRYDYDCRF